MSRSLHVFISPHLDDAVLSCGATVAQVARRGDPVEVLTIFAGVPSPRELSGYAKRLHSAAGGGPDLVNARRSEDQQACGVVGARFCHWDYLDAPYRRDATGARFLYTSDEELMGWRVDITDLGLVGDITRGIARRYRDVSSPVFYAPLGAGGHVDHLVVRLAGQRLAGMGSSVAFYEDYPYVEDGHRLVRALALGVRGGWRSRRQYADETIVLQKCDAIGAYRSQVPLLFGEPDVVCDRVRSYMALAGEGEGYAERFWDC